jgi:hypothetical protein
MSVMRRLLQIATLAAIAIVLTLASSVVHRTRLEVQDWDCPPPPASCARPMLVLGFPFPYISDYHGISVVGSASLTGALLGEDLFHRGAFLADVAVYVVLAALTAVVLRTVRRRPPATGAPTPLP